MLARSLAITLFLTVLVAMPLPGRRFDDVTLITATFAAILWFTLGGHYADLLYWKVLRPDAPFLHEHPYATRLAWWSVAGLPLGLTASFLWTRLRQSVGDPFPLWWGAPLLVFLECAIHAARAARGRPSLFNGKG